MKPTILCTLVVLGLALSTPAQVPAPDFDISFPILTFSTVDMTFHLQGPPLSQVMTFVTLDNPYLTPLTVLREDRKVSHTAGSASINERIELVNANFEEIELPLRFDGAYSIEATCHAVDRARLIVRVRRHGHQTE